jgi:hypothetical protein
MRQAIRTAWQDGFARIAVVCGAWQSPALAEPSSEKADAEPLAGLKRAKVVAAWIPWTSSRLAAQSGYGAGVRSPGWYEPLWTVPDRSAIRWVARAAALLRAGDLDAFSSNVIDPVRLAEILAALRGLPLPGLAELHEAIQTVRCRGESAPGRRIRDRLEIGEALGEVPPTTPTVPSSPGRSFPRDGGLAPWSQTTLTGTARFMTWPRLIRNPHPTGTVR